MQSAKPPITQARSDPSVLRVVGCFWILWIGVKSAVGPEYAPLNTGASITRGNSGNGALPTRESGHGEDENKAGQ